MGKSITHVPLQCTAPFNPHFAPDYSCDPSFVASAVTDNWVAPAQFGNTHLSRLALRNGWYAWFWKPRIVESHQPRIKAGEFNATHLKKVSA